MSISDNFYEKFKECITNYLEGLNIDGAIDRCAPGTLQSRVGSLTTILEGEKHLKNKLYLMNLEKFGQKCMDFSRPIGKI